MTKFGKILNLYWSTSKEWRNKQSTRNISGSRKRANALDSLERAEGFIRESEQNLMAWKWVVLALHGALYGFAVCACKGTDYENVTVKTRQGHERLISLDKALEMCQDQNWMGMLVHSQPLGLTDSQKESIRLLKKVLRNNFEHYIPKGGSIEVHGLPKIAMDILDVIRFLTIETGTFVNLNIAQMRKVKSLVYQSKRVLNNSELHQEALLAQVQSKTSA